MFVGGVGLFAVFLYGRCVLFYVVFHVVGFDFGLCCWLWYFERIWWVAFSSFELYGLVFVFVIRVKLFGIFWLVCLVSCVLVFRMLSSGPPYSERGSGYTVHFIHFFSYFEYFIGVLKINYIRFMCDCIYEKACIHFLYRRLIGCTLLSCVVRVTCVSQRLLGTFIFHVILLLLRTLHWCIK